MLLSGGKPPAQEWFMVQTKSKPRVHRQRSQVQRIFRVKVTAFQSRPDTPYFWSQSEGPRENTGKAKEYSKGSCNPELWKEVRYPPVSHCAFLGAQGLFSDCLCWSTSAYSVPGPPGSLMVGGSTESFTMTQNWSEESVARLRWGPAPMITPRGVWETEVTRAFGASVWIRCDKYAGDLSQLPPAVQESLLSLVRDAAGKEDIIEWLGHFGISGTCPNPEISICLARQQKESASSVTIKESPGTLQEIGALNRASENSKKTTSSGAAGSSTQAQSPPAQETADQLARDQSNKQGDETNSVGEEGTATQDTSSQDSENPTQALLQQKQVPKNEERISLSLPVSASSAYTSWKVWAPGTAFGPSWPGTIAATFWKINESQSLHLAWLSSQACLNFPFWQRPTGPIQSKSPGRNPLPLKSEWKQKESVPSSSAGSPACRPGGDLGRETALKHSPRPEIPSKIISLSVVPGGCGIKEKVSPGLSQVGQSSTSVGDKGISSSDCKGSEKPFSLASSTEQGGSTAQERPSAQVPEAPTVSETLQVATAAEVSNVEHPPTGEGSPATPKVPTALKKPAVYTEPTAPKVPSAPTEPAAPATPTAPQTPTAQKTPSVKTLAGLQTPKVQSETIATAGSEVPKAPAASAVAGPTVDVAQLSSEVQASKNRAIMLKVQGKPGRQGFQPSSTVPSRSKHQFLKEGLLGAWEGSQRSSPHSQGTNIVTSFQRYNEALNTPFEMNLSEEPGNPGSRRVVIDGSSVAMVHGSQHFFSCRGIAMAVQYFWNRGHREITVFVPTWQSKKNRRVRESHFSTKLHRSKMSSITPSQSENGKKITTYDYRFMVKSAEETDGVIVTNEQIHILMNNSKKSMVKDRSSPFTFAGSLFMVPDDPSGRDGPTLEEFSKKPNRLDMDIGNFLKVWKTSPPSSASISESSDDADAEPLEDPQDVEEAGKEEGSSEEEPGIPKPDEEDEQDTNPVSVFGVECPSFSEEILQCLSSHDPSEGTLDIDLSPVVSSPYSDVPWDGKAPCQQVSAQSAQLNIPSNFTALSFFMGFMDSHRDVISDYEDLVGPSHGLLKQKPDWQWNQEHEKSFSASKRALVCALCSSTPNPNSPFYSEVTVSQVSSTASLHQEHSGRKHPIAYTSKPLLPDEDSEGPQSGGDSPYAVAWALKHFARCVGDNPVVLRLSYASRTTVDNEAWDSRRASKAWLIRWSLLSQDKGKRELELSLLQGSSGENQSSTPPSSMPRVFQPSPPSSDSSTFICVHVSGYCFYRDDELCAGFGLYILSPTSPPVSLAFSCSPYTTTYAHSAAVACGLERFGQSQHPVVFLTHCNWIFSVLWELSPLWRVRGFSSSDGASLPHPSSSSYIISLTSGFSPLPFIYRTSYRGSSFAVTVDTSAKQGAQGGGQWWDLPKDVPVPMVTPHPKGRKPNLSALQSSDTTSADIIAKLQAGQKLSGPSPFSSAFNSLSSDQDSGSLMFKGERHPRVWVVPRQLRRDSIFSVHDSPIGEHQGLEDTYKTVRSSGWWPGMQDHVRDYCRSCLFCIPRNLIGGESKVIESPWPLRSTAPWSSSQIEVVGPVTVSEEGHKHVLIVADANTRWVEAFPSKPYTHVAVAQVLLQHVFARWGVPIRSEAAQGPQFARHVSVSCGSASGAQVTTSSRALQFPCSMSSEAYWEFKRASKEFIFSYGKKWAASSPLSHSAFRASTTEATPFQVSTGGEMKSMEPVWWEMSRANIEGLKMDAFLSQSMRESLDLHWRVAEKASEKAENRRFKRESQENEWSVGDQVLLLSLPRNGSSAKWMGPFYIGDRLSLSLYRVWGFPVPDKSGCVYPSSSMKAFPKHDTPSSLDVEQ